MATKKLEQAIASGVIKVKNVATGEVKLNIKGREVMIAHGQTYDIGARLDNPREAMLIHGFAEQIKLRRLVLV